MLKVSNVLPLTRCPQAFDQRELAAGKFPEEPLPSLSSVPDTDFNPSRRPRGREPPAPSNDPLPTR